MLSARTQTISTIISRSFLDLASDADFWRELNPGFAVTTKGACPLAEPVEFDIALLASSAANVKEQGFFHLDSVLDRVEIERMAGLVLRLVEMGWPAPFAAVYDDFWKIIQRCNRLSQYILGYDYKLMPNFWVFHIPGNRNSSGWAPHRDRPLLNTLTKEKTPATLRLWIPLTSATASNSCINYLPANLDPDYPDNLLSNKFSNFQNARCVPAAAGSILGWNEAVLHWGGSSSDDGGHPRVSIAFTLQANVMPYESPLLDPMVVPDFSQRLGLIGQMIRRFEVRDSLAMSQSSWKLSTKLCERFEINRCLCTACGGKSQIELDAELAQKPTSFRRALGEASKFADYALQERVLGNISQANRLASRALDMIGLKHDVDFVEAIESQILFHSENSSAADGHAITIVPPSSAAPASSIPSASSKAPASLSALAALPSPAPVPAADSSTQSNPRPAATSEAWAASKTEAELESESAIESATESETESETESKVEDSTNSTPQNQTELSTSFAERGPEIPAAGATTAAVLSDLDADLEQTLTILVKALGPQDQRVKDTLCRLIERGGTWPSSYYNHLGPFYQKLLQVRESELGAFHPEIADRLLQYATYLENNRQSDLARACIDRATAIRRERAGVGRVAKLAYAQALSRLGANLIVANENGVAETKLREALAIIDELNWRGILAARVMHDLAGALTSGYRTNNFPEAEALYRRTIELGMAVPELHILLRECALKLGGIYLFWGRTGDAIALFQHNRYFEHYQLVLPAMGAIHIVQSDAITASSNPYLEVINELNQKFSPPDLCTVARQVLVRKYAWAIPSENALSTIKEIGPVVEIGAGTGYWAAWLKARGVDIIAYDAAPMETGGSPYTTGGTSWTEVKKGDDQAAAQHPDRALMLCWPNEKEPMALNAVNAYTGHRIIYVGEGRGGKTGDQAFHDALEHDWTLIKQVVIDNWHRSHDYLAIYERKTA